MDKVLDAALQGVVPPIITPLDEDGRLDEQAFGGQLRRCRDAGCSGVFVNGSSGEGPWLTRAQRRRTVEIAVESGTVVLAGVMLPGTSMTREAAADAAAAGADAIVVSAPYYFAADDTTIERHVRWAAAATDRPVILYNIPQLTHNPMSAGLVARLAREPSVIGIKDSSGDLDLLLSHLELAAGQPFRVLQGAELEMAESLRMGADGLVPGLANVFPEFFTELQAAVRAGDEDAVADTQARIEQLFAIFTVAPTFAAMKAACSVLTGFPRATAAPLAPASADQTERIRAIVEPLRR